MNDPTLVVTPECIMVYPDLFEPTQFDGKGEAEYRCTLLIHKSSDITALRKACQVAALKKWPNQNNDFYKKLRNPIRDGNEKAIDEHGNPDESNFYFDNYFLNVKSKFKPAIVNIYGEEIQDTEQIYGGCLVKAQLSFYAYKYMNNLGVSAGLRAICKTADGEPLGGGRVNPKEVFSDVIINRDTWEEKIENELGQMNHDPIMDARNQALHEQAAEIFSDRNPPPQDDEDIPF